MKFEKTMKFCDASFYSDILSAKKIPFNIFVYDFNCKLVIPEISKDEMKKIFGRCKT